jgi:hypothetical protein
MISIPSLTQANKQDNNLYFIGDPEITFFKSVFKRHSNFAIESFTVPFIGNTTMVQGQDKKLLCKIPTYGDLLGKVFLRLSVPPMKTTNEYKFKFNDNFGLSIIKELKLKINGILIETLDARILYTLYMLHHTDEERKKYTDIINGSIHNNIYADTTTSSVHNSKTYVNKYYNSPIRTENEILYIPLDFACTHFYKTYLPLFLLENKAIEIEITLREFDDMFTIEVFDKDYWYYDKDTAHYNADDAPTTSADLRSNALGNTDMSGTSVSATSDTMLYGEQTSVITAPLSNYPYYLKRYESRKRTRRRAQDPTINNFTYNTTIPFSLSPSIQVEQIFLTKQEKLLLSTQTTELLIQQVFKKEFSNIKGNQLQSIVVENHSNLIKELVMIVERNDNDSRNQFLNFTNYEHAGLNEDIIRKYQDNWWYDASGNELVATTLLTNSAVVGKELVFFNDHGIVVGDKVTYSDNGKTSVKRALLTSDVVSNNELVFASAHSLSVGDSVIYMDWGGLTVTGLENGSTYFVLAGTDNMKMKLATTSGGINIITGGGALGNKIKFSLSSGTTYFVLASTGNNTKTIKLADTATGDNIIDSGGAAENTITFSKRVLYNETLRKQFTITNDKFQDFLFKYGPYGEAGHGSNDGTSNWTSNTIQPQYRTYTIEEIDEFRKIWHYRDISNNIPIINSTNFSTTFSEQPLVEVDILFDGAPREDIKEASYYNKVQPFLHHTNDAEPCVYPYSFSLRPEEYQPSGFCNMNMFRKIQYKFMLNQTELKPEHVKTASINTYKTTNANKEIYDSTLVPPQYRKMTDAELTAEALQVFNPNTYDYNINIYSLKYNFITIKDKECIPLYRLSQ